MTIHLNYVVLYSSSGGFPEVGTDLLFIIVLYVFCPWSSVDVWCYVLGIKFLNSKSAFAVCQLCPLFIIYYGRCAQIIDIWILMTSVNLAPVVLVLASQLHLGWATPPKWQKIVAGLRGNWMHCDDSWIWDLLLLALGARGSIKEALKAFALLVAFSKKIQICVLNNVF